MKKACQEKATRKFLAWTSCSHRMLRAGARAATSTFRWARLRCRPASPQTTCQSEEQSLPTHLQRGHGVAVVQREGVLGHLAKLKDGALLQGGKGAAAAGRQLACVFTSVVQVAAAGRQMTPSAAQSQVMTARMQCCPVANKWVGSLSDRG